MRQSSFWRDNVILWDLFGRCTIEFKLHFFANFTSRNLLCSKIICFHLALAYFCFQVFAPQLSLLGGQDFPNGAFPFLSLGSNVGQHTVVISLPGWQFLASQWFLANSGGNVCQISLCLAQRCSSSSKKAQRNFNSSKVFSADGFIIVLAQQYCSSWKIFCTPTTFSNSKIIVKFKDIFLVQRLFSSWKKYQRYFPLIRPCGHLVLWGICSGSSNDGAMFIFRQNTFSPANQCTATHCKNTVEKRI